MKERVNFSAWKNEKSERTFRALEDGFWREYWTELPASIDVETHLGPTRVYAGAGDGEPIVFLHGIGGTSIMWADYFAALDGRAAYAIDTIGDLGRSEQRSPVKDAADLARWLDEVLAELGIDHAHLAGTSYGGFVAVNLAVRRPARVRSVALFEPAGIVRVRLARFMVWGFAIGLSSLLPQRLRQRAARKLRMPLVEHKNMTRMIRLGQFKHRTRVLRPEVFTDEQLASIAAPVLLMVGEKSEVFSPLAVRDRATTCLPDVEVEMVAGAGHAVVMSDTDVVVRRFSEFLELHDSVAR
jgi:pimeloyl-ACP methyl ester carboxylesterase